MKEKITNTLIWIFWAAVMIAFWYLFLGGDSEIAVWIAGGFSILFYLVIGGFTLWGIFLLLKWLSKDPSDRGMGP